MKISHEELVQLALQAGAAKAVIIPQEKIVLSAVFRDICASNTCGGYGKCWMCPPDIGPVEELMKQVQRYSFGLLYQTIGQLEDSFDLEGINEATRVHTRTSQKLQQLIAPRMEEEFLHLSCGGCHLCERCAKQDDQPCRQPDRALSSMEGYGIDVYNTTKGTGLKYINGPDTVTYFGMVLFGGQEHV